MFDHVKAFPLAVLSKSDKESRDAVTGTIDSSPFLKTNGIDVTVHERTATLCGTVKNQDSIRSAIVDAYGAGVRNVVRKLQVEKK